MSVYGLLKFFLSRQYIPVWYTPTKYEQCNFIIYDSAGRERTRFQQLSKLIELANSCEQSHPPADKCMPKAISDHTENIKVYINLASCSS